MRTHYKCFDCGCDSFEIEFEKGVTIERAEHIYLRPEQIIVICKKCHAVVSDGFHFFQES